MKAAPVMSRSTQRGYSLIELVVAMLVGVFLLAGLFTIFQGTRNASSEQAGLAELQDEERVAMTMITNMVQSAGYYPNVVSGSGAAALPADGSFKADGQSIFGTHDATSGNDTLAVRFQTAPADSVLNCNGQVNGTGAAVLSTNTFAIAQNATTGVWQLTCIAQSGFPAAGGTAMPLVNAVTNMTLQFAVNTKGANSSTSPDSLGAGAGSTNNGCPADTYILTQNMTDSDWTNVCAVQVTLTLVNPLYQPPNQPNPTPGQLPSVVFQRVIAVMTKAGVNSTAVTTT